MERDLRLSYRCMCRYLCCEMWQLHTLAATQSKLAEMWISVGRQHHCSTHDTLQDGWPQELITRQCFYLQYWIEIFSRQWRNLKYCNNQRGWQTVVRGIIYSDMPDTELWKGQRTSVLFNLLALYFSALKTETASPFRELHTNCHTTYCHIQKGSMYISNIPFIRSLLLSPEDRQQVPSDSFTLTAKLHTVTYWKIKIFVTQRKYNFFFGWSLIYVKKRCDMQCSTNSWH